jgi:hypothetical protein
MDSLRASTHSLTDALQEGLSEAPTLMFTQGGRWVRGNFHSARTALIIVLAILTVSSMRTGPLFAAPAAAAVGSAEITSGPQLKASDHRGPIEKNLEDKSQALQIDSKTLRILNWWPPAPGADRSGRAIGAVHRRLSIGCRNRALAMIKADTGKFVITVPVDDGVDPNRVALETKMVLGSNGDGALTLVHGQSADRDAAITKVPAQRGAHTMELDLSASDCGQEDLCLILCFVP